LIRRSRLLTDAVREFLNLILPKDEAAGLAKSPLSSQPGTHGEYGSPVSISIPCPYPAELIRIQTLV
jgi:hypothetical protein